MATLRVDTISLHFEPSIEARKYDDFQHYRDVLRVRGMRAVDVVAVEAGATPKKSWKIEVKDYRVLRGEPKDFAPIQIAEDFFRKINDTHAGLADAAANATNPDERSLASRALRAQSCQFVLHLEPYAGATTKLFPKDPTAGVYQKLKQLFGPIEPPLLVVNIENTRRKNVPWTAS